MTMSQCMAEARRDSGSRRSCWAVMAIRASSCIAVGCTPLAAPEERGLLTEGAGAAAPAVAGTPSAAAPPPGGAPSGVAAPPGDNEVLPSLPLDVPDAASAPSAAEPPDVPAEVATAAPDAGSAAPVDPGPPAEDARCGADARFRQSCYRPSTVALPWEAARDACRAIGGELVHIENTAEDAFVGALLDVTIWIGAADSEFENFMQWTDGTPVSFASWGPGQPDLFQGPDCVEKRQEEPEEPWYDQPCSNASFYVCEYEPAQ